MLKTNNPVVAKESTDAAIQFIINYAKAHDLLICIVGMACSGKDTMGRKFIEMGVPKLVSYTTRAAREGEVDGVDYHFIDEATYDAMEHSFAAKRTTPFGRYGMPAKRGYGFCIIDDQGIAGFKKRGYRAGHDYIILGLSVSEEERRRRWEARGGEGDFDARNKLDRNIEQLRGVWISCE